MAEKKLARPLRVGDRVRIRHTDNVRGRIVEFRGPLGPGGALVYRIRIAGRSKPTYAEVLEDQLIHLPTPPKLVPAPTVPPVPEPPTLPPAPSATARRTKPRLPKRKLKNDQDVQ